jgi:hypothetical protein
MKTAPAKKQHVNQKRLWLTVLILWVLWAIRAHNVMALPVFVDESLHILRAQVVYDFTDAKASILPAKLLLYYYFGLFGLQDVGGAWLARQAIVLLAPLGAALSFTLARLLFRRWTVGILTMLLYALTPFLLFFERMALADPFAMIFGLALAIVSIQFARRPSPQRALWVGLWLGLAMLAKLLALPWVVLPVIAVYFFGNKNKASIWELFGHQYRTYFIIIGLSAGLSLAPSAAYMVYQELNPPENKIESVEQDLFVPEANSRLAQIGDNFETYIEASRLMFTDALLLIFLSLGIWQLSRTPKEGLYLIAFTLSVWILVIITAARPSTRYLVLGVPTVLILTAAGIDTLYQYIVQHRESRPHISDVVFGVMLVLLAVWGINGVRFITTAWDDPTELNLAERDIWEYYQNSAAGYGLREVALDLPTLTPLPNHPSGHLIPVAGFVGACHTMRLYLPADSGVGLQCPLFRWSPEQSEATLAEWQQRVETDGVWYIVADVEQQPLDLFSLPFDWQEIAHYSRPVNGTSIKLFRVTPLNGDE